MPGRLGLKEAKAIVDTMLAAGAAVGRPFAAAVVDSGGELIHFSRMDGASALNVRMAVNKAYTAVKCLSDTRALKERLFDMSLGNDRRDIAWFGDARMTAVWGGILLKSPDGTVLGAIGESGGTPAQDEEVGQVGARHFATL